MANVIAECFGGSIRVAKGVDITIAIVYFAGDFDGSRVVDDEAGSNSGRSVNSSRTYIAFL